MSPTARQRAGRQDAWKRGPERPEHLVPNQENMPSTLAGTLLAIRKRRGELFMLDSSRWLIGKWDFESDRLQEQSEETIQLVQRLLTP